MLINNNMFSLCDDGTTLDTPFLVNTDGLDLDEAFDLLVDKCRWIREEHYQGALRIASEQAWPDMFHIFARAGWTITPKLLKENLSSVIMSIALGAAIQYADRGAELWTIAGFVVQEKLPGPFTQGASLRAALRLLAGRGCALCGELRLAGFQEPASRVQRRRARSGERRRHIRADQLRRSGKGLLHRLCAIHRALWTGGATGLAWLSFACPTARGGSGEPGRATPFWETASTRWMM